MKYAIVKSVYARLYNEDCTETVDDVFSGWMVMPDDVAHNNMMRVVTWYGYTGYILTDDIRILSKEEFTRWTGGLCIVRESYVDVLDAPDVRADRIGSLIKGSFVKVLKECKEGWTLIKQADGASGYVRSAYIVKRRMAYGDEQTVRRGIVSAAMSYYGVQYRWGGKSSLGMDCSGLAFMSYMFNGIIIYRDAQINPEYPVKNITCRQLEMGDLIYWPGHVAIYIGNCRYIHATAAFDTPYVTVNSLNPCDDCYRDDLAKGITACGSFYAN